MRVVLTQYEGIEATPVLPLAAGCLVSCARMDPRLSSHDYGIAIERLPILRAVPELGRPDVLGISLYPWNAAYTLAVAAAARQANSAVLIVAGGPSVPRRPDRAIRFLDEHPFIDILAFGEGEFTFREILRNTPFEAIPGIAFRGAPGQHHVTAPPARILDFTQTASPYLDGTFDALYERHRHRFNMALCETNRGCPFSCTFCDWSITKRVVEFPIERVHAELDWVVAHGFSHVMLADANFGIRPRDTSIARRLVDLRRETGRPATFYFYLTKNNHGRNLETIEILQAGKIGTWVGLAVQDFDDDVLAAVKRDNIQTGEAMKLRDICGARGVPTFNELILGLPGQTAESFTRTIATAMPPLPHHDFVLFLCRLIENTELGDPESRRRFGIETRRCQWKTATPGWDPIIDEFQEVVVATRDMPPADWRRTFRLSFLAAALYNLRLLRVVLHHVPEAAGIPLAQYLELLAGHMGDAQPGTVYAELDSIFERYTGSLLDCGPFVLPFAGTDAPLTVDEAAAAVILRRYSQFLAETESLTRRNGIEAHTLAEAFRYQSFLTTRWRTAEAVESSFQHDWPAYVAAGGSGAKLLPRAVRLRFTPPHANPDQPFDEYISSHFAASRAQLSHGRVEHLTRAALHTPEPAPFVILPAGS